MSTVKVKRSAGFRFGKNRFHVEKSMLQIREE